MKKTIILSILILSILTSCKSLKNDLHVYNKKEWVTAYKNYIVVQTLRKTGIDLNKDNSGTIQFEILGASSKTLKEIDSLSNKYSQAILSSSSYFEGKPIVSMILNIYTSKELDIIANNSYTKGRK